MSKSANPYRVAWPIALTLVALTIALTILIIFLRLESWPARTARQSTAELERLGKNLRAAFVDIAHLQPRITINDRVYMEQTKAGFDLRKGLSIDIRLNEIMVQLPHAQILGVEQQQMDVLAFENGLWNRISGQDLQSELSVLPELAWKKALESELPAEAEKTLQQQLEQRIHTAQPLRLIFKDERKSE